MKRSLEMPHFEVPRRRWTRLVLPFFLLVAAVAAWRTEPHTWRQLRMAALGGSPTTDAAGEGLTPPKERLPTDAVFAGKGEIDVEGGLLTLFPLTYGEIEAVTVKENDRVAAGAELLRIRNKAAALQVEEARQGVRLAEIEVEKAKRAPEDLKKQLQLADIAVQSEERLVAIAQRNLDQLRNLGTQVSQEAVRTATDAFSVAQQRWEARRLERDRLALRRPLDDVRTAETNLERMKAKLAQAVEEADRSTLKARTPGRILKVNASVGETFGPATRQPAFLLCPDRPWIVRCEIEQEFAGRVHVGMTVEIRDDATGERIGDGTVDRVSGVFAPRRQPVEDARLHNDLRTMECIVLLKSNPDGLRIGQHVRALFRPPGAGPSVARPTAAP
jgi:multidrug resistance efflux pump